MRSFGGRFNRKAGSKTVDSVFGRVGVVGAEDGDYLASQIVNNTTVPGARVADALQNIIDDGLGGRVVLHYGANFNSPGTRGRVMVVNGAPSRSAVSASDAAGLQASPIDGELRELIIVPENGDTDTDFKLIQNGATAFTAMLAAGGTPQLFDLGRIAVALLDILQIEFDAGSPPDNCAAILLTQEL